MSSVKRKSRRLESFRAKVGRPSTPEAQGKGKAAVLEAKKVNLQTAIARKKVSGKAAREFDSSSIEELNEKLTETRKELFNMRFKHATGQLENAASLPATRRRIARILTLIKQKEVGA